MQRFQTVDFDKINKLKDSIAEVEAEVKERVAVNEQKLDRIEIVLADLASAAKAFKDYLPYLKVIAGKEYPQFPDIPKTEFPKIQKVEVSNPSKVDFTDLKNLLSKVVVLLSAEKKSDLQPIIIQSPVSKEAAPVEDTAHASQLNVRTRAKSRLVPEIPSGAINSVNATYFLSRAPRYNTQIFLFREGQYQTPGGVDYTITGNEIKYVNPMLSDRGDGKPEAHYVLIFQA